MTETVEKKILKKLLKKSAVAHMAKSGKQPIIAQQGVSVHKVSGFIFETLGNNFSFINIYFEIISQNHKMFSSLVLIQFRIVKIQEIENMTEQVQAHVLQKYNLLKKVGSGAYGHVWKVTDKRTGDVLALKKIFDAFQHSTDAQRTYREIVFLHELNHPNIIKLYNVIKAENEKDLYLVFQFMDADLHNAIGYLFCYFSRQKILKDAHNRYIIYQLVKGLKFMHSAQVIHRDLKPSNLLLNSDCHLRICDFGLARSLAVDKNDTKDVVLTQEVATRWYRAPQVLLGSNFYDKSADIWSVGCILAEVLIGKPIFPGNSTLNQLQRILSFSGKPKQQDIDSLNSQTAVTMINQVNIKQKPINEWFKSTVPQDALDLVTSMLSINPKKRPTAAQILKHPFLASFHKPKEEAASDKIIHPPISDNTKLNLKQYRRLIYERIKKLYSEEKQVAKPATLNNAVSTNPDVRKSVERSIVRQQSTKAVQKKYLNSQEEQDIEKQVLVSKNQKIQRPSSQNVPKKSVSSQVLNNGSFYRNTKTSNSNYTSSKNANRYSSTSNQKKTGTIVTPKYSTSSHHSSMHQYSSEEAENLKKKNSLKQILKAKRQTAVESNYNISQTNQANNIQKAQTGVYAYHPSQVIMSNPNTTSGLKSYQGQSGYIVSNTTPPSKYQNYTGPFTQQHPTQMHQNSLNSYTSAGYYQQVQSPTYSSYSNYQHGLKENKPMY